jgi:hypothetical protein
MCVSTKEPAEQGHPLAGLLSRSAGQFDRRIATQRPTTGLDRPMSPKLVRALRSSCDDHHKKALFHPELRNKIKELSAAPRQPCWHSQRRISVISN